MFDMQYFQNHKLDQISFLRNSVQTFKVVVGPKQLTNGKLEANYHDLMYENCYISASKGSRHLKIGKERAYTMIYHKMD